MKFKDQVHAHVRPTVRIRYVWETGGKQSKTINIPWDQYKDQHTGFSKDRYVINVQKLMEEKSKKERYKCRAYSFVIGGSEIRRDGFGNNAFMDVELRFPSLHAVNRQTKQEYTVERKISCDVVRADSSDLDADRLHGSS